MWRHCLFSLHFVLANYICLNLSWYLVILDQYRTSTLSEQKEYLYCSKVNTGSTPQSKRTFWWLFLLITSREKKKKYTTHYKWLSWRYLYKYRSHKAGKLTHHGVQGFQKEWSPQKFCERLRTNVYVNMWIMWLHLYKWSEVILSWLTSNSLFINGKTSDNSNSCACGCPKDLSGLYTIEDIVDFYI